MNKLKIERIAEGSIFEEMAISPGDAILTINGAEVADIMDYRYLIADEELLVEVEKQNGEIWELEIEKDFEEDLGLLFHESMIETRTCRNNCIFCFIDQMPPGMRETLYVKDDDERLSFLLGNYITLTNLTEDERERIIRYRIMPINISVHTTDPELRCKMLGNRFAGTIMTDLRHFAENGTLMNGQIVLCPGYNDGEALRKTLEDLCTLYPQMVSVSAVPVGLSKFREGLAQVEPFDEKRAAETIDSIETIQSKMSKLHGTRFVYASDELYLLAKRPLPEPEAYDGFPQIENGVGMLTDFQATFDEALQVYGEKPVSAEKIGIITGTLAADFMRKVCEKLSSTFSPIQTAVFPIENHFFGERITVSGLITGQDIIAQVKPDQAITRYLIPANMVKQDEAILLDDTTLEELEEALQAEVVIIPTDGRAFIDVFIK